MNPEEHGARVDCVARLTRLEGRFETIKEIRDDLKILDSRVLKLEQLVQVQANTLTFVREQVGSILEALEKFQDHTKLFEKEILEYRLLRETKEQALSKAASGDTNPKADGRPTALTLIRTVIELKATWVIVGIIIAVLLLFGVDFWKRRAEQYVDHKFPPATSTPTAGRK